MFVYSIVPLSTIRNTCAVNCPQYKLVTNDLVMASLISSVNYRFVYDYACYMLYLYGKYNEVERTNDCSSMQSRGVAADVF